MDALDHKKNSPSGHEGDGVYLCNKCGWPFPNPHPSARHRRAHKRVCGNVEGYPLIDSESGRLSDNEQLSDDDMRTPSPKMEKGVTKEIGSSGGTGLLKSYKSEDEVFSDAVTEFSESGISPSMEEHLERVGQLEKNVGKELACDLIESQQTKDDGTDGTAKVLNEPTTMQSENTKPAGDIRLPEVSVGVDQIDGLQINSSPVVLESISKNMDMNGESKEEKVLVSSGPEKDIEVKESVMEIGCCTGYAVPLNVSAIEAPQLESKLDDLKEGGYRHVIPEAGGKTWDTVFLEPKLHETDTNVSHCAAEGEIEQEKELSMLAETGNVIPEPILHKADGKNFSAVGEVERDKVWTDVSQSDVTEAELPSQIEPPKNIDGSGAIQAEADSAKDILEHGHNKLTEDYEFEGEGDKETHLVIIPESLPVIENPKILTQDFKDHKVLKSSFPLDLGDAEVTRPLESDEAVTVPEPDPASISNISVGSITSRHSDVSSSDNLEKGVLAPVGDEVNTSGLQLISEGGSGTTVFETQMSRRNHYPEGFEPNSIDEKLPQNEISAPSSMELSDVIPAGSAINEETTNLSKIENADDDGISKSDCVITECRNMNTIDDIKTPTSEKCKDEVNMEASQGLEIGSNSECSPEGALGAVSECSPEDHNVASDKQLESSNIPESQGSISGGTVSELIPEDQNKESKKNSEDLISKEPAAFPVDSVISNQSTTSVEDINIRDATALEPLIDEDDGKLTIESFNVSAVDNSVVSSSRTESLEGNWGSVSVLSTPSDGTALTDAEVLSTGPQAPEKSEGTSLKPQTATDVYHPDKSDVYEPPSFMTLVASRPEVEKTAVGSEIQTVQKAEPTKSEALQAGWIPSLTNIVNDSEGRKKNEELIAKVTKWSSGKQHSPLKNLLNEAHAETTVKSATEKEVPLVNQADETASKNNGTAVTTVSSIMGSETPGRDTAKKEMEKEWNLPARYPSEIKKEKKKGKPYWVPFVCCTSIHQDM